MGFRLVEILCVFGISQRPRNSSNIGLHPVNLLRRCVLHRLVGEIQIHLSTILLKKQLHLTKRIVLFHYDNASANTCAIATAKLVEICYKPLPHPPHSSDLVPCDLFLCPNLKNVNFATEVYFAYFQKIYIFQMNQRSWSNVRSSISS